MATATRPRRTDDEVLDDLVAIRGRAVLDVGCGGGAQVRRLAGADAAAVLGLELSDAQLAAARAADPGHPERYVVGTAQALPLADATLDVVLFGKSLHHVPVEHMGAALAEARRVLRPGGEVVVTEPLTEGSYFELLLHVEDETAVRAAAQAALADAAAHGLERARTVEYDVAVRVDDLDHLHRRVVAVDPERAAAFDAAREALAALVGDGRTFVQPMRADLLRAV